MTIRPGDPERAPRVSFIGAGPGDVELMTLRGRALIEQADVLIYADSLVDDAICAWTQPHADIYRSSAMTLEETTAVMVQAVRAGRRVVRVQSGDPSLYGAIHEQMAALDLQGDAAQGVDGRLAFAVAARHVAGGDDGAVGGRGLGHGAQATDRRRPRSRLPRRRRARFLGLYGTRLLVGDTGLEGGNRGARR